MGQEGKNAEAVRLNKYISEAGVCSRREADRLIESGKVLVDGERAGLGRRVRAGERVTVDGREIAKEEERLLLAVNKPRGVVCTTDQRWGDETIYDVIHYPKRVFSVGRLDKESEGLLLLTNDGDILNKILRAGNYHEKEYLVSVDRPVTPKLLEQLRKGVYLEELGVVTRPCRAELAGEYQFRIVLTQGLNRQIRRMCEACHYSVVRLVRVRIMNIELGNLKPGEYRRLSRGEYARLLEGLKDSVNPGQERAERRSGASREGKRKEPQGTSPRGQERADQRSGASREGKRKEPQGTSPRGQERTDRRSGEHPGKGRGGRLPSGRIPKERGAERKQR